MNCPACGMDVPDSSCSCPYCETRLSEDDGSQDPNPPSSNISKKDDSRKKSLVPTILLAIVCAVLIGICIYLSNSREAEISAKNRELAALRQSEESLSQQISELDGKIGALSEEAAALEDENNSLTRQISVLEDENNSLTQQISAQEDENNSLTQQISDLSAKNSALLSLGPDYYNQLYTERLSGNIGYASDTYYTDEGIVFMRSSETKRTITITARKGNAEHISFRQTLGNAKMEWNNWDGKTTSVTVTPNGKGVSSFTFTNDGDSDTFKIIVVVTN